MLHLTTEDSHGGGDPMAAKRKEVPTLEQAAARVFEMHRPNLEERPPHVGVDGIA